MIALLVAFSLIPIVSSYYQYVPNQEFEFNENRYVEKLVQYRADPATDSSLTTLEGLLIYNERYNDRNKGPAVIIFHSFLGRTAFEDQRGRHLARLGYVVLVADVYGKNVAAPDVPGNFAIMGEILDARTTILRGRILAAWNQINSYNFVDKNRIGSIGYCFGGLCTLDLARFNVGLVAAVSFHGTLTNYPDNQNASHITTSIQAHHPDLDVYTTEADADVFLAEMKARKADWWWLRYSNAHHAFTYHDRQLKMLTIFVSLISSIMLLFCTVNCKGGKNKKINQKGPPSMYTKMETAADDGTTTKEENTPSAQIIDSVQENATHVRNDPNCNFLKNEYAKVCFTFPPLAVFTETKAFCEAFVVSCEAELKTNIFTNLKEIVIDFSAYCKLHRERFQYVCPDPIRFHTYAQDAVDFCLRYNQRCPKEPVPNEVIQFKDHNAGHIYTREIDYLCVRNRRWAINYCTDPDLLKVPKYAIPCGVYKYFCVDIYKRVIYG